MMKFILIMSSVFSLMAQASYQPFRAISPIDNPDALNPKSVQTRNIRILDESFPKRVVLDLKPWAAGHWALEDGILGKRYADRRFLRRDNWQERYDYVQDRSVAKILSRREGRRRAAFIDTLSPAEKYDLLIGDPNQTLTYANWTEGGIRYKKGTLSKWMGICEGSAAASVIYPEPKKEVVLMSPQGDAIRFHILDIKGLAALQWSGYNVQVPVVGSRCDAAKPMRDDNGVLIDDACFNSNPGSWHVAVLNYLGQIGKPLFINRTNNQEVWNVPIIGYNYVYFNVVTGKRYASMAEAILPVSQLAKDKYRRHRTDNVASIIGVDMTVRMTKGAVDSRDDAQSSPITEVNYVYDLELGTEGQILGGEWHSEAHPDFMWAINDPEGMTLTRGDRILRGQKWDGGKVPAKWLEAARTSARSNQPLDLIVQKLIELSQ